MNTTNCKTKKVSLLSRTLAMCLVALFCSAATAIAQNVVKGTVRDASGEALPGVTVTVKGQKGAGAVTDMNGNFSINAPRNAQLTFTYVGMKPQTVSVGNRKQIAISLTDDESTLNDVVVVGYGQAKKMTLTGAVSAMKGDELLKGPSTNISSLLGGKLPGLTSLQESGEPGDDQASLRIRGSQYSALYIVDGMPRSINDIDPNDVESVSVLKDGASAAVYGLNAAGGVIIVTTKQGVKGKPKVSYDGQYGVSMNANFPEFMDGPEFAYYFNLADYMDKLALGLVKSREDYTPIFTREDVQKMLNNDPTDGWDNVNYIDKVFGTGHTQKHNLSLRGGTDAVKYYVSMGYMNQKGNIDNFNYRRYNLRTNLEANVGKGWTINVGVVGTVGRKSDPRFTAGSSDDANQSTENSFLSIGKQAIVMQPYLPMTYNGLYTGFVPANQSTSHAPLAAINQSGYRKTRSTELNSNISVTYDAPWLKGLKFKATGSYDYLSSRNKNLSTPYQTSVWSLRDKFWSTYDTPELTPGTLNKIGEGEYITESLVGQLSAEYTRLFGKHNVDALVLVEGRDYKGSSMAAYADHVPFAQLPEINFGTALSEDSQSGYSGHTRTAGYVFRLKYDYNNTYMAEFSGRYDGSYNFSGNESGKRWGFFPSFSAGWRISQEKFMQSTHNWLTDLKIRGSIGLLGNDGVPEYSFLSTYALAGNRIFNGTAYSSWYTNGIANPTLTWSKTRSSNVGFDATFWDGLLSVEFDYFYNLNYDLLTAMGGDKAPSMGGYYYTYENNNRYSNYGLEWTITHRNKFNLAGKPFQYQASVNMTYAKSKWLRYPDSPNTPEYQKVVGTSVDAYSVWIGEGLYRTEEEIENSAWYGGRRPQLGDIRYRDVNGDGIIDDQDRMRVGRSNRPEIMMGINLGASWNGFDLSMQFTGGFKFDVSLLGIYYNGAADNTVWTQTFKEGANSPLWLVKNSYSDINPNGKYPRITEPYNSYQNSNGLSSTFWMMSGNYLRLKTAQLGYTLPKRWMDTIGIERVRVFVEGSNLFTIDSLPTGIDPESPRVNNGYYPQQRTIMGGINVTF